MLCHEMDEVNLIKKILKCPEVQQCGSVVLTAVPKQKALRFPLDPPDVTQRMRADAAAS